MILKVIAGVIAMILVLAYLAPPAIKLQDPALLAVIVIGVVLIAIDLWQSLRSKDD